MMSSLVVVIAARASQALSPQLVTSLQLENINWLADHQALEGTSAESLEALRRKVAHLPIDINCVATTKRRKKLLLADMDSTMVEQECIDELGHAAGFGTEISAITARAMAGDLDFEEALKKRVSLLRGLPLSVITELLETRINDAPGGKTLLATMTAHGAKSALVSGGFHQFTEIVAKRLGFTVNRANDLISSEGKLTGQVAEPILGKQAKLDALHQLMTELKLEREDTISVGDGANDIPMLQASGLGVALHAKPLVQQAAPQVINHSDLTALLYLQGYHDHEFVNK